MLGNIGNWGEPFLGRQIDTIVQRLHDRGIFTTVSSNLSLECADKLKAVCDAGLDYLIVSIDGASQEVYSQYRRNGRLAMVLENVKRLLEYRAATGRVTPIVEWQFLGFRHNAHEIEVARSIAKGVGFDVFRVITGVARPNEEMTTPHRSDTRARDRYCKQLWHNVVLAVDGRIAPCCYLHSREEDFGSIHELSLAEIRRSSRYVEGRSLFGKETNCSPSKDHPCLRCEVYTRKMDWNAESPEGVIGRRFAGDRLSRSN